MVARILSLEKRRAQIIENANVQLTEYKHEFDKGDRSAILDAIWACAICDCPMPEWLAHAFEKCYGSVIFKFEYGSWDDVFGKPNKGRKLTALRRNRKLQFPVVLRVRELRAQKPKPKNIYAHVGREFGISAAEVKKLYSQWRSFYFGHATELLPVQKRLRKLPDK